MNNEEKFRLALMLADVMVSTMEPIEAQMYAEACERAWAGQEQLRGVRK